MHVLKLCKPTNIIKYWIQRSSLLKFFPTFPSIIYQSFTYYLKFHFENFSKKQAKPWILIIFSKLLVPSQNALLHVSSYSESDFEIQPLFYLSHFECFSFHQCIFFQLAFSASVARFKLNVYKCTALINVCTQTYF